MTENFTNDESYEDFMKSFREHFRRHGHIVVNDPGVTYQKSPVMNVELDPSNPVHRAIIEITSTLGTKNQDYAGSGDTFVNFTTSASHLNLTPEQVAELFIITKLSRLKALRENIGHEPNHESVEDTYKDIAGYAVLAYAMYLNRNTPNPGLFIDVEEMNRP